MTSSSEKGTSPKPESLCSAVRARTMECGQSKDSDLCLSSLLTERRRRGTGNLRVTTAFFSALCKVLQSVLTELLLNPRGHSLPVPLVSQARATGPHIMAVVEIEGNQATAFRPKRPAQTHALESKVHSLCLPILEADFK